MKEAEPPKTLREDPLLGMVKHPVPTRVYRILGVRCLFSYSFWHLSLFAFTFTYLNIVTLFEFAVYPTLMTGNYFNSALDIRAEFYHDALFRLSLIGSCTLLGTALDCYLVTALQSRHNAFAVLMALLVVSVVVTDLASDTSESKYSICILCVTGGGMVHWSQKLGYTCSAMTGNFFKLSEYFFKWFNGYDLGGPKVHGEIMIVIGIVLFSFVGASLAVTITKYHEVVTLYPLLATIPFHLYLSGCCEVWGWVSPENPPPSPAPGVEMKAPVQSPLQSSSTEIDSEQSQQHAKENRESESGRSSLFDSESITPKDVKDLRDIEKSFEYISEKAMDLTE